MNIAKAQCAALRFLSGKEEVYFIGTHEAFLGTSLESLAILANSITYDTKGFDCTDAGADMWCSTIRDGLYFCYTEGHAACSPGVQQAFVEHVASIYEGGKPLNFVVVHTGS